MKNGCGRAKVPVFIAAMIVAVGFSITGCPNRSEEPRTPAVESVTIATVPPGATTVTRGAPLPFTVEVSPADAPQGFAWNVLPAGAGGFNAANEFTVSDALAHGATVTITAAATDGDATSAPIGLTVNVIPTGVTIATVPPGATTVTRGAPLPFIVEVSPAYVPQEFAWTVLPAGAGSFNAANEFTVSDALAHGATVAITAAAVNGDAVSTQVTLAVNVVPILTIDIDWAGFDDLAPDGKDVDAGSISLLTGGAITLGDIPAGVGAGDIRWYIGGTRIGEGATLVLTHENLGVQLGPRYVTLVVVVGDAPYSIRIAFTVTM